MAREWDYDVIDLDASDAESIRKTLNKQGDDGWDFVSVALTSGAGVAVAVFRRSHRPEEPSEPLISFG
jgi:hypothetical protein